MDIPTNNLTPGEQRNKELALEAYLMDASLRFVELYGDAMHAPLPEVCPVEFKYIQGELKAKAMLVWLDQNNKLDSYVKRLQATYYGP